MEWSWIEIDEAALEANLKLFRQRLGANVILAVNVKSDGYGHGLVHAAQAFQRGGADWLCVHSVAEAVQLRAAGLKIPIHLVGPVAHDELEAVSRLNLSMVLYNTATLHALETKKLSVRLHLKVETGNHRQGVPPDQVVKLASQISIIPGLTLEGVCSHFANIEDTTDHRYARRQQRIFAETVDMLEADGHLGLIRHLSNSASALLWPDQGFELVRIGIGAYGHWPSQETRVAAQLVGADGLNLRAALTWKTRIAQVKEVPKGAYIGYGCTYMTTRPSRIAILPIGYFDGYDRALSNVGHALCHGARAPVRGRVCMNITMIDITDIPQAELHDEVVLIGADGAEEVSADLVAGWQGSINYEVLARIGGHIPRYRVRKPLQRNLTDAVYRGPTALIDDGDAS